MHIWMWLSIGLMAVRSEGWASEENEMELHFKPDVYVTAILRLLNWGKK
ncbi:hypothetical protein HUG20_14905 [Salicibibacter cibi]|uniref:Uncharacterized protein n=1 Tax=Salicibibacter cibi TaxID=2743001 RepID=A0A7T6ZCY4_9BACI|nr:hypothetical protein [Salicibibacter cibi]QQK81057.1 hypothetical protein HUG20_14905 [Salicibibacter cibi]